jgi:hypothetical protein
MDDTPESVKIATEWGIKEYAHLKKEHEEAVAQAKHAAAIADRKLNLTPEEIKLSNRGMPWENDE